MASETSQAKAEYLDEMLKETWDIIEGRARWDAALRGIDKCDVRDCWRDGPFAPCVHELSRDELEDCVTALLRENERLGKQIRRAMSTLNDSAEMAAADVAAMGHAL